MAAYAFNPDLAIAVNSTPAIDLPIWDGSENTQYNTRLGLGPAIYIADGATISDPRLVRHLAQTAEALCICPTSSANPAAAAQMPAPSTCASGHPQRVHLGTRAAMPTARCWLPVFRIGRPPSACCMLPCYV